MSYDNDMTLGGERRDCKAAAGTRRENYQPGVLGRTLQDRTRPLLRPVTPTRSVSPAVPLRSTRARLPLGCDVAFERVPG